MRDNDKDLEIAFPNNANAQALKIAQTWIGTPYRHQGNTKSVGCDCLGLIRGIWRELYGAEPEAPPAYSRRWAEITRNEPLLAACQRWLIAVDENTPNQDGMLLLFRWHKGSAAKHLGIMAGADHFIHAYSGQSVLRSSLVPSWRRRIAGRFHFPPCDFSNKHQTHSR